MGRLEPLRLRARAISATSTAGGDSSCDSTVTIRTGLGCRPSDLSHAVDARRPPSSHTRPYSARKPRGYAIKRANGVTPAAAGLLCPTRGASRHRRTRVATGIPCWRDTPGTRRLQAGEEPEVEDPQRATFRGCRDPVTGRRGQQSRAVAVSGWDRRRSSLTMGFALETRREIAGALAVHPPRVQARLRQIRQMPGPFAGRDADRRQIKRSKCILDLRPSARALARVRALRWSRAINARVVPRELGSHRQSSERCLKTRSSGKKARLDRTPVCLTSMNLKDHVHNRSEAFHQGADDPFTPPTPSGCSEIGQRQVVRGNTSSGIDEPVLRTENQPGIPAGLGVCTPANPERRPVEIPRRQRTLVLELHASQQQHTIRSGHRRIIAQVHTMR